MGQILRKKVTKEFLLLVPSLAGAFKEGDEITFSVDRPTPIANIIVNEELAKELPELKDMGFGYSREKNHEFADEITLTVCSYTPFDPDLAPKSDELVD